MSASNLLSLKLALLEGAKQQEICPVYHSVLISTTEDEIALSGLELFEWSYSTGVIDEDKISMFSQEVLNRNGVYNSGTHNLVDPAPELDTFVCGTAIVNVILADIHKHRFVVMGGGILNLTLNDYSFATIQTVRCTSTITIDMSEYAVCMVDSETSATINITAINESVITARTRGKTVLNFNGNNEATLRCDAYHNSEINLNTLGNSKGYVTNFQNSILNENVSSAT